MRHFAMALLGLMMCGSIFGEPVFDTSPVLIDDMWNNPTATVIDESGVIHSTYMTQFHTDSNTKEIWYARKPVDAAWQFLRITNNSVREEFPTLQLDTAGNVHIAFHTGIATTNQIRYVNNIGAAPGTFNSIIDITGPGYVIVEMAIDSTGKVHFVFRSQFSPGPQDVFYTTYSIGGGVGSLVNLSQTPAQEDSSPQIAIDPDDKIHVVWQRGSALEYMNNVSGSFQSVATSVAGSVLESWIIIPDTAKVSIFYRPNFDSMMYIETDESRGGFTAPAPVYTGTYRSAFQERIGVDTNGHRYVVFSSNITANLGVFLVQETEGGWQLPQLLSKAANSNLGTSVSINSNGKLAITYSRSRVVKGIVIADIFLACADIDLGGSCVGDLTDSGGTMPDGQVNVFDLFVLLSNWNTNGPGADIAEPTNIVDVFDLFVLLGAWGNCP